MRKSHLLLVLAIGAAVSFGVSGCGGGGPATSPTLAEGATVVTLAADRLTSLEARVADWAALVKAIRDVGADKTSELAAFLWPKEEAQSRAKEYQQAWSEAPGASDPISKQDFDSIARVTPSADGTEAVVVVADKITGSDGLVTKGLDLVTWTYQAGLWYRTTSFWVPVPRSGGQQPLDVTVRVSGMTWSPISLQEMDRLLVTEGKLEDGKLFLVVGFYVSNGGETPVVPSTFSVGLYDAAGDRLPTSSAFANLYGQSVAARDQALDSGMDTQLFYCFEVPGNVDLAGLRYEIKAG